MNKVVKIVGIVFGILVAVVCWVALARTLFIKTYDAAKVLKKSFYNPCIWEYGAGTWVCEELNLEFTYVKYTSEEESEEQMGKIVKDGETIDVVCAYTWSRAVELYDKKEYDESIAEHGGIACEPILIIKYDFDDKNPVAKAVVTKDILFGGEYLDKEVTLKKVE